jgi:ParB family chromosome partitioning protein
MQLLYLAPEQIERDPEGIRENEGDLTGLAETIRHQGLLQPLGVVPLARERYRVVYGGRRLGAAMQLGLERVPCIVLDADDPDLLLQQIIENVQRLDLNDLEKARAFKRLREQIVDRDGVVPEGDLDARIGQAAGIAPRTVRRYLGLLDLPEEVQELIRNEELSVTQAQHLRRIPRARTQIELARMIADEGMSAADVSNLANYFAANPDLTVDAAIRALEQGLQLRTEAAAVPAATTQSLAPAPKVEDDDAGLWEAEPEDEQTMEDARRLDGLAGQQSSQNKARVFKVKSLDQLVDETDRMVRTYHEGDLRKWVKSDEGAAYKLRLLLKQLRSLSRAIEELASENGLSLADE